MGYRPNMDSVRLRTCHIKSVLLYREVCKKNLTTELSICCSSNFEFINRRGNNRKLDLLVQENSGRKMDKKQVDDLVWPKGLSP